MPTISTSIPTKIQIGSLINILNEKSLFDDIEISNTYEISSSLPQEVQTLEEAPSIVLYRDFILPSFNNDLANEIITTADYDLLIDGLSAFQYRTIHLSAYTKLIEMFMLSGKQSAFLRPTALTGAFAGAGLYTGLDLYKNIKYEEILDIQQLKKAASKSFLSNPCFLMDSSPDPAISPLKLSMVRTNFQLLCRTIILFVKLQNLFISSVFNNTEFYKSGNYKDSTFTDFCFNVFVQKVGNVIPDYKDSIYVFLGHELKKKISDGEDIYDPISNEIISFVTPMSEENLDENVTKYIKSLFLNEFLFMTDKMNAFFSRTGTDKGLSFSLAPTTSFGTKLLSAKEYFLENLALTGVGEGADGTGTTDAELFAIKDNELFLELFYKRVGPEPSNDYDEVILNLKLKVVTMTGSTRVATIASVSDKINNTSTTLFGPSLINFMLQSLNSLKTSMIVNDQFLLLTNYVFPLNKILSIVSIFHFDMIIKLYESMYNVLDGSIRTLGNIHDIILGNENKIECESSGSAAAANIKLGVDLEILKAIATAPLEILKGMEETFDPNIFLASKIRKIVDSLTGVKTPIIPYSLGLLPAFTIPPPIGVGPPLISPYGYIYWALDAAEVAVSYAKNGIQVSVPEFGFEPISEDPKSKC